MDDVCAELIQFMKLDTRLEIKLTATKNVLNFTGSAEGRSFILNDKQLLEAILSLTKDPNVLASGDCIAALVNLSTEDGFADIILNRYNVIPHFFETLCNPDAKHVDRICMILSNITRTYFGSSMVIKSKDCEKPAKALSVNVEVLQKLIELFIQTNFNKHEATFDYLAPTFANLTQLKPVREVFLDSKKKYIVKLFPFLQSKHSSIRRGGVASAIRNCCFEYEKHPWLLSEEVDALSQLLLPLAGPEEFSDEDTDLLPLDLQYLDGDKTREDDPDVRTILIESLILLCADKPGRMYIKSKNVIVIVQKLLQWESEKCGPENATEAAEKLLQVLLTEEPEDRAMDNLLTCKTELYEESTEK